MLAALVTRLKRSPTYLEAVLSFDRVHLSGVANLGPLQLNLVLVGVESGVVPLLLVRLQISIEGAIAEKSTKDGQA